MPTRRAPCITSSAPMCFSAMSRTASRTGASGPIEWTSGAFASSSWRTVRMGLSSGWGRLRGYSRCRYPGVDEIEGPLLGFHVQAAEVLADQAQRDQLYAAEQQDHCHQAGPARDRIAPHQRLGHHPQRVQQREQRGDETEVGRHPQRRGGKTGDAFEREVPQRPEIELAASGDARVAFVPNRRLGKTYPAEQALHEALAFAQLA